MGHKKKGSVRNRILLALINLASLGTLVWALRDANLGELADDLATMNWWWVLVAVVTGLSVYLLQAVRWRTLLRPVDPLGYWHTVRAIFVGMFANEVLPLRAGEVVRCYLLSRGTPLPLSISFTSAVIERVFDGIWLSFFVFLTLRFVPIPKSMNALRDGAYVLVVVVLVLSILLAWGLFKRHRVKTFLTEKPWQKQLAILLDDLELIGHSRYLVVAFLQTLPYMLMQVLPILAGFLAYGFDLGIGPAFALMVFLRLSSAVPQAPGNVGLFQLLTKETLEKIYGIPPAEAARFSLLLWAIITLPLLVTGMIALSVTGLKFSDLQNHTQGQSEALPESSKA